MSEHTGRLDVTLTWDADDLGPAWMNIDNLNRLLFTEEHVPTSLLDAAPSDLQAVLRELVEALEEKARDKTFINDRGFPEVDWNEQAKAESRFHAAVARACALLDRNGRTR